MDPVIVLKEGSITRKFKCPFCGYVHVFSPRGKKSQKKRVTGFTCPGCGKKPTQEDFNKIKGRGPKPKGKRRKRRVEKKVVEEISSIETPQPIVEQIKWKTRIPSHTNPWESQHPGARIHPRDEINILDEYKGRQPRRVKTPHPTRRSFGEVLIRSTNIKPSAPIYYENLRSEEKMEKRRAVASREERRVVKIGGRKSWLTLTELRSKLDGTPTKHVLAVWDEGERTTK